VRRKSTYRGASVSPQEPLGGSMESSAEESQEREALVYLLGQAQREGHQLSAAKDSLEVQLARASGGMLQLELHRELPRPSSASWHRPSASWQTPRASWQTPRASWQWPEATGGSLRGS